MSQCLSHLIYHARCLLWHIPSNHQRSTILKLFMITILFHFMCSILGIVPKDWWAVKEILPLTLCWHAQSLLQSVNLTLHIHQQQASCQNCPWASELLTKREKQKNPWKPLKEESRQPLNKKNPLIASPSTSFTVCASLSVNEAHLIG